MINDHNLLEDEYLVQLKQLISLQEERQEMKNIEKQIQLIDIEIEAIEHAIEGAMGVVEKEELVQSVSVLQQKRYTLIGKEIGDFTDQ